jgi:signal transduction histidine kinase
MNWTYKSSIKRKVMTVIMLASVTVLLVTVVAFVTYDVLRFRQSIVQNLTSESRLIAENSAAALAFNDQDDALNVLSSLRSEPNITAAAIYDNRGRVFVKYPPGISIGSLPAKPEKWSYKFEKNSLSIFEPVVRSGAPLGTIFLRSDLSRLWQRLELYGLISFLIIMVSLLIALVLSNMLQRLISNPVIALANTARNISEKQDYSLRAIKFSDDELGLLTDSFNVMLERIQNSDSELRDARDQALAASQAKDAFLAALSHELRTPLNPVLLIASDAETDESLPPPIRKDFETIRKNVELEARLIDDLLDLSRIIRGKLSLNNQVVDVHNIIQDAIAHVSSDIQAKEIELLLNLNGNPSIVNGDAVRLQQIFWNVLKNAAKFTPHHGRITIATSTNGGQLNVQVTDTGIGLTQEELNRIFEPFSQGDHATYNTHRFGGLGLGLTISRQLVELHHGKIQAESIGRDKGATFIIELPIAENGK